MCGLPILCYFAVNTRKKKTSKGEEKEEELPVRPDKRQKEIRMKIGSLDKSRMTGGVKMERDVKAEKERRREEREGKVKNSEQAWKRQKFSRRNQT